MGLLIRIECSPGRRTLDLLYLEGGPSSGCVRESTIKHSQDVHTYHGSLQTLIMVRFRQSILTSYLVHMISKYSILATIPPAWG